MGILYIISLILLGISFMMFKKSEKELNFIKWIILYLVSLLAYNILIGMILGLLNITSHILLLSIINIVFAVLLGYKPIKNKEKQKYFIRKIDIAGILLILVVFSIMFVKDLYIYKGDISHFAVDSAIHYRAAKHYADNLKIFINVEDKSFFNFNVMQPGAYINDGIFMNVIHSFANMNYAYLYQTFETMVMFLGVLAFYSAFMDKIKTKRGLVGSLVLLALYLYGYPYNSWIYGFSYLSVGIAMVAMLLAVVELLFTDEKIKKYFVITMIGILGAGLIFSYCLFVPAIFAGICIFVFIKELLSDDKKYIKFFGKNTLIITGVLLVVTAVGIGYLFVPTFFIAGQTDLVSALKIDGAIYSEKYVNFLPYIPFAILYVVDLFKRIKKKEITYLDVFAVIFMAYFVVIYAGMLIGKVSPYYMLKLYNIIWMVVFAVSIDMLNKYVEEKLFRLDIIVMILLYPVFLLKHKEMIDIGKSYLVLVLVFYMVLGEVLKRVNQEKIEKVAQKLKVSAVVYVTIWGLFVCGWVDVKAGHVIGEEEKHAMPNLVGMYYSENCEYRKLIDLTQNFNRNEIKLATFARENLTDLNAENIELITEGYYTRIWATAVTEVSSDSMPYENFIQDTNVYTVNDAIGDPSKKYIVKLVSNDQTKLDEYQEEIKKVKENEKIKILMENDNGFVAEIIR